MVLDRFVEHTVEGGDGEKEDTLRLPDMWVREREMVWSMSPLQRMGVHDEGFACCKRG